MLLSADARSDGVEGIGLPTDEEAIQTQSDEWRFTAYGEMRNWEVDKMSLREQGLPGFVHPDSLAELTEGLQPSRTPPSLFRSSFLDRTDQHSLLPSHNPIASDPSDITKIAQDYCSSRNLFKSMTITTELYGWKWTALEAGLINMIKESEYIGQIVVHFKKTPEAVIVRPDTILSRVFEYPIGAKILLWLFLLYPIILILERSFGVRYNLRVAFPLTRWRVLPIPASSAASSSVTCLSRSEAMALAQPLSARLTPKVAQLPDAQKTWVYLTGTQEGEWLRAWEEKIVDGVNRRRKEVELTENEEILVGNPKSRVRGYNLETED